ncbi:WASH complex subunit 1-like [Bacillus rossius redtenbacheri]|uniref:WASH complex subunit 1-like n=1 Tax=Bacillus rossius redtenbacheri TaxID=93214 RepID=UPI002FDE8E03
MQMHRWECFNTITTFGNAKCAGSEQEPCCQAPPCSSEAMDWQPICPEPVLQAPPPPPPPPLCWAHLPRDKPPVTGDMAPGCGDQSSARQSGSAKHTSYTCQGQPVRFRRVHRRDYNSSPPPQNDTN